MQVVSGRIGNEHVHFEAPEAERLEAEMTAFLKWFNAPLTIDPVLKAGVAHFWFVTIHPFEDGNGRTAWCNCRYGARTRRRHIGSVLQHVVAN